MDIPNIETEFFETIDPYGPYGAKGLAETAIKPTAAAISNAVSHAIGAKIKHLPLTPELVLKAIKDGK
jgi:CO/xanthine dehydrogenase Mo-binding subunit